MEPAQKADVAKSWRLSVMGSGRERNHCARDRNEVPETWGLRATNSAPTYRPTLHEAASIPKRSG